MTCINCGSSDHEVECPEYCCINYLKDQIQDLKDTMASMSDEIQGFNNERRIHTNVEIKLEVQEKCLTVIRNLVEEAFRVHPEHPETYPEILNSLGIWQK